MVAGKLITATMRVNKKIEKGSRACCASDMQSKRLLAILAVYSHVSPSVQPA